MSDLELRPAFNERLLWRAIREYFGICVVSEGTRPVRLRAYPQGTDWQGWYASGKTRDDAYRKLVYVLCRIPAFPHLHGQAAAIIEACEQQAREAMQHA